MSTPLRDLIGDLLGDPSTRVAFAADPAGFLRGHGWDGLDGPDVRAALTALAEELPIEQASRVVEALGEGERFAEGLDGAIQGLGLAAGLDAGDLLVGESRTDPQLGLDEDAPVPVDDGHAPAADSAAPPADADVAPDDPTATGAPGPDRAGLGDATLDPTEGIDSGPDERTSPGLHDNGQGPHPDPAGGLDLDTAPPDELVAVGLRTSSAPAAPVAGIGHAAPAAGAPNVAGSARRARSRGDDDAGAVLLCVGDAGTPCRSDRAPAVRGERRTMTGVAASPAGASVRPLSAPTGRLPSFRLGD